MYNLYKQQCPDNPVKLSMYRHIFVSEFNIDFHTRKSDRCDLREEFRMAKSQNLVTDDLKRAFEMHIGEKKNAMRENRKTDRKNTNVPVLCFDLQIVIACSRAEKSSEIILKLLLVLLRCSPKPAKCCRIITIKCVKCRASELCRRSVL